MLSAEDNALLTLTGPGTQMGDLLRRYWIPALLAEELPDRGADPVRLKVMGERLVAFRDYEGRIGVLQEFCAHRRASLFYGRNESAANSPDGNCGLRCAYHGWKYDIDGRCVDMPNEPSTSRFKEHIRLTSYPAVERGGVIWVYMGPAEQAPALPELEWAMLPTSHCFVSKRIQHSNFMQAMEGGIDSSHVSFLHADAFLWNPSWTHQKDGPRKHLAVGSPKFFVEPTDYGLLLGARRVTEDDEHYWRVTQWLMPWYSMVPRDEEEPIGAHAWVPIDDESCWVWSINYVPERPLSKQQVDFYRAGGGIHAEVVPGTYEPVLSEANNYRISRALQKTVSISGIAGIAMQDVAMQESMGKIADRTKENLGSADAGVIAARKRLLAECRALAEANDTTPSGLEPESQRVRSTSAVLPKDVSWVEATAESRRAAAELYAD